MANGSNNSGAGSPIWRRPEILFFKLVLHGDLKKKSFSGFCQMEICQKIKFQAFADWRFAEK
jgi:hypothetical protein